MSGTATVRTAEPVLVPGVCSVWWTRVTDVSPAHDALLGEVDLERRSRLVHAADRQRLTAAWATTRLVLGSALAAAPAELVFDRTCPGCGGAHGKPRLPEAPHVQFSASHSGDWAAVAVHLGGPVGLDIEQIGRFEDAQLDLLAAQVLTVGERQEVSRHRAAARAAAFTTYWTRKEAVVKATGDGMSAELDRLVVSPPSEPPRILRWDDRDRARPLCLHTVDAPPGYVATLAVDGDVPPRMVHRDAGPLLRRAGTAQRAEERCVADVTAPDFRRSSQGPFPIAQADLSGGGA